MKNLESLQSRTECHTPYVRERATSFSHFLSPSAALSFRFDPIVSWSTISSYGQCCETRRRVTYYFVIVHQGRHWHRPCLGYQDAWVRLDSRGDHQIHRAEYTHRVFIVSNQTGQVIVTPSIHFSQWQKIIQPHLHKPRLGRQPGGHWVALAPISVYSSALSLLWSFNVYDPLMRLSLSQSSNGILAPLRASGCSPRSARASTHCRCDAVVS